MIIVFIPKEMKNKINFMFNSCEKRVCKIGCIKAMSNIK